MAERIKTILQEMDLTELIPNFMEQKITPDIICRLTEQDFQCLGLTSRNKIMELRTACVTYGSYSPPQSERKFEIPSDILESLLELDFTITEISNMLCVSESTVYRRMREYGLSKSDFSEISDAQLDALLTGIMEQFPNCGEKMVRQILLGQHSIKVQRSRLRDSMHRLDDDAIKQRKKGRLHRRVYNVQGPNHLWHIDTNHKLIRWNFVIAGGIDGFSRLVTFIECTNNNRAETVFECFMKGVNFYGLPLRVRTDKGLENIRIAEYMLAKRGENRGSILAGKSTHNQRIERLWRDVYDGVLSFYYQLFYYMEDIGILDVLNKYHILALHHVYLKKINMKLELWRKAWASHRIRTVNSSPLRLYTAGMINNPVEVPVEDLENYGIEGEVNIVDQADHNERPLFNPPAADISQQCKHQLDQDCPPDWSSQNYGLDIYRRAIDIISSYRH